MASGSARARLQAGARTASSVAHAHARTCCVLLLGLCSVGLAGAHVESSTGARFPALSSAAGRVTAAPGFLRLRGGCGPDGLEHVKLTPYEEAEVGDVRYDIHLMNQVPITPHFKDPGAQLASRGNVLFS